MIFPSALEPYDDRGRHLERAQVVDGNSSRIDEPAMIKVDEGHAALTTIARTYGQLALFDANEAETRLKVIDEIVFNVLGWQKEDVSVEERVSEDGNTRFADYVIRTATIAILIEAKRATQAFSLPTNKLRLRLSGVLSEGDVGEAIRQARDYCRTKGIPFAVATNGSAWIVFPAARTDQVSFEESEARVFRDLEDVQKRFVELILGTAVTGAHSRWQPESRAPWSKCARSQSRKRPPSPP
jgi:hypothetical protein